MGICPAGPGILRSSTLATSSRAPASILKVAEVSRRASSGASSSSLGPGVTAICLIKAAACGSSGIVDTSDKGSFADSGGDFPLRNQELPDYPGFGDSETLEPPLLRRRRAPIHRVAQQAVELRELPGAMETQRGLATRFYARVDKRLHVVGRVVTVAKRDVGYRAVSYLARIAENPGFAIGKQRGVAVVCEAKAGRRRIARQFRGQKGFGVLGMLEFDQIELVRGFERLGQSAGDGVGGVGDMDVEFS